MTLTRPTIHPQPLIGWKEYVGLPLLGAGVLVAKIDTGARIAALHADGISVRGETVHFTLALGGRQRHCALPLIDLKRIKSSNGQSEMRPVIETEIHVGSFSFTTAVTLTNRTDMGVPMLLGRATVKGRFLVHPARSFLLSGRKKKS